MEKNKKNKPIIDIPSLPTGETPETAFEMVNNYGTYNIQATALTENMYPAIAQGFNEKIITRDCQNKGENKPENNK